MRLKHGMILFFKSVLGFLFTEPDDLSEQKWLKEGNYYQSAGLIEGDGELQLGEYTDSYEAMTSNTAPSPLVASASNIHDNNYQAWKAFNYTSVDYLDCWHSGTVSLPQWLKLDFGSGNEKKIQAYKIRARHTWNISTPVDWKFQGSNNDIDWDDLDDITGNPQPEPNAFTQLFVLSSPKTYRYYRLWITLAGGGAASLSELRLYEVTDDGDILATSGHRISNPQSLNSIKSVKSSNINWESEGEDIKIYTQVNEDDTTPTGVFPDNWEEATNDSSITDITGNLTGKFLWIKQDFNDYTKLLCHFDGTNESTTIIDSSSLEHNLTVNGNAKISTDQHVFGNSSLNLYGGSVTAPNHDSFYLNTDDFTIDLRVYFTNIQACGFCGLGTQAITGGRINWHFLFLGNTLYFYRIKQTGGQAEIQKTVSWTPSTLTWYHLAVIRFGNDLKFFINGSQQGSTQDVTGINYDNDGVTNLPLSIGSYSGGAMAGYIDELRISKGIARWTSNFTPPTSAYFGYPSLSQLKVQID